MSTATVTPTHWAVALIGTPYRELGNGPDAFDCWGFTRHVQATHYGLPFPDIERHDGILLAAVFAAHPELRDWVPVARPRDGDVVTSAVDGRKHIGTWLDVDGGGVLHCVNPGPEGGVGGVCFTPMPMMGASGWARLTFWRHRSRLA